MTAARRDLAGHGKSLFRVLSGAYRQAVASLRGLLATELPKTLVERLAILDGLIRAKTAERTIDQLQVIGSAAFGSAWSGTNSDWPELTSLWQWHHDNVKSGMPEAYRQILARIEDLSTVGTAGRKILEIRASVLPQLKSYITDIAWNVSVAFDNNSNPFTAAAETEPAFKQVPLDEFIERLEVCLNDPNSLSQWVGYRGMGVKLGDASLIDLTLAMYRDQIPPIQAVDHFYAACYEAVFRRMVEQHPELSAFIGSAHDQVIQRFRDLDRERIKLASHEVAAVHYRGLPNRNGEFGQLGVLMREIEKKRRHLPIRQLLKQAGTAIRAIKPVFMMSPMSIAQYLEPGSLGKFDLLLIDEASQVLPEDALGAVARANQVVVVGDSRQLPPTSFFQGSGGDSDADTDADDDVVIRPGDMESILALCSAQGLPDRMLRWHYRSRHHSLIAVSNHEFYDNRLYVIPSPSKRTDSLGLAFRHLPHAVFDRGRTATNRIEAEAIAEAVVEHARERPNKTLGVGAFSVAQRDAVLDALELKRRENPDIEEFFATGGPEPFFVKNLENVQGDERDVIFITVGYGRDESGGFFMNFGPLSKDGGERRLNVLITRARERTVVFSSITADDIDLGRARGKGPKALKAFLQYAKTEVLGVAQESGRAPDSPFEEAVASALTKHGFTMHYQVGVAGFFIDLAVVDPDTPGRYMLGIECDGATYHSSRSARDRDRIRQTVLEDRGWRIHRIWSTDWFNNPDQEIDRCMEAIVSARSFYAQPTTDEPTVDESDTDPASNEIHREEASQSEEPALSEPYHEASFNVPYDQAIHEIPTRKLATIATQIVEVEGPIHGDEVACRVRMLWGLGRTGSRITQAVHDALKEAQNSGHIQSDGAFYTLTGTDIIPARNREDVSSPSLRNVPMIPPKELVEAVMRVVIAHYGMRKAEVATAVSRILGYKSTSAQLRDAIEIQVDVLISNGSLKEVGDALQIGCDDARANG